MYKISIAIATILLFDLSASAKKMEYRFKTENIDWHNDSIKLAGSILIPKRKEIKSVIILIPGSGNLDRRNRGYELQAKGFASLGIATVYYDKRGRNHSGSDWKNATLYDYADDVVTLIHQIRKDSRFKYSKIGVAGYSQGSWVADIVSTKTEIDFIVHVSGTAQTVREQIIYVSQKRLSDKGYPEGDILEASNLENLIYDTYVDPDRWDSTEEILREYENKPWYKELRIGLQPKDLWNWKWLVGLPIDFDPKPIFEKVDIPMLVMNGTRDRLTDVNYNTSFMQSLIQGKKDITLYEDPTGQHVLKYQKKALVGAKVYYKPDYWEAVNAWAIGHELI